MARKTSTRAVATDREHAAANGNAGMLLELLDRLASLQTIAEQLRALVEATTQATGADRSTIFLHDDAIDSTHALCQWVDVVHHLHRMHFVRQGDVAPCQTQRRQTTNGSLQVLEFHRKVAIRAFDAVLG